MSRPYRAAHSALFVIAGALGIVGASSTAVAQGSRPRMGVAADPAPERRPTTPYPGATVTIDPSWYTRQQSHRPFRHPMPLLPVGTYYVPAAPSYYGYYPSMGYGYYPPGGGYGYYPSGGNVYDTNGRPLSSYDWPAPNQYAPPIGTPDLSGSPYVVLEGGAMAVDFGNGDQRAVPSCTTLLSQGTPDGQPRTVFYQAPGDGLVLRAGQRGRVIGTPAAGARVCYTVDQFGRMVLDY
jgi:hypothetical protein